MFEFDPAKSAANKAKHGIDFVEAQALWDDQRVLELGIVMYEREERRLYVGDIDGCRWTAVVTHRDGHIRIISVRRARAREEMAYDG
ncbi:BrnT family toxin [Sphingomonas sp.]|uniref:BrnT family toxin n=1 Tax=Sphingomonas sp. TaxID=28214 RepID=UPI0033417AA6